VSVKYAHVKPDAYGPGMQKAWKGRRGAKWVRKLEGGEEDKGGDLLPKLLLTPLLPALRLSTPSLLWALLAIIRGRSEGVGGSRKEERGSHNQIRSEVGGRRSHGQRQVRRRTMVEYRGCDLQTQWSERVRLDTMRTFPAALEMGIAQHTTRGEDRPLLSPMGSWGERVVWGG
jgi:hypothetical protein